MQQRLIDYYKQLKATYEAGISLAQDLDADLKKQRSLEEQCDTAFAIDQCNKMAEDLSKELRKVKYLAERITNLICLKTNQPGPVKTPYVSASLRSKMAANIPPRDSDDYAKLCGHLGVPTDAPVRIHYPTIVSMVTEAIEGGRALPPGLGELRPEFHLTLRKQKEVDAE